MTRPTEARDWPEGRLDDAGLGGRSRLKAPGLGESQGAILELLKRQGRTTIPMLALELGLNIETVRHHLKTLAGQGLVRREGSRRAGPGRPEVVYGLTPEAESLFPRREGEILRELASYLVQTGNEAALGVSSSAASGVGARRRWPGSNISREGNGWTRWPASSRSSDSWRLSRSRAAGVSSGSATVRSATSSTRPAFPVWWKPDSSLSCSERGRRG